MQMKQISFATLAETGKKRKTKRERFLEEMEAVVPEITRFGRFCIFIIAPRTFDSSSSRFLAGFPP